MRQVYRCLLVAALAAGLAGCITAQPIELAKTGARLAGVKEETIANVQKQAIAICGYLPEPGFVSSLVEKAGYGDQYKAARAICNAVTTNPMAEGNRPGRYQPRVAGVRVKGKFVR